MAGGWEEQEGALRLLRVRKKYSALLLGTGASCLSQIYQKDRVPSRDFGWLPCAAHGPPGPSNT